MLSDEELRRLAEVTDAAWGEVGLTPEVIADAIKDYRARHPYRPGPSRTPTDNELRRLRDHATANPSHAGDVVLRLVAEVERLRAGDAATRTDAELAAMRADAAAVAAARAALVGKGHTHDSPRWQAEYFVNPQGGPNSGIWHVTNEHPDARERYDLFEDPPQEFARLLCEWRNRPLDGHVLALLAEVGRLRAGEQGLARRLEGLMGRWGERRDGQVRESDGGEDEGPAAAAGFAARVAAAVLRKCVEELDAAIANRLTADEEAEARRLYEELQRDIATGEAWGMGRSADRPTSGPN